MQVRLPLGVEQYEMDGRPDGNHPFDRDSVLEEFVSRKYKAKSRNGEFVLTKEDFQSLNEEGILYYYRYLILYQTGDYERTIRDTEHNLSICTIIDEYYHAKDKNNLLQYRPYIIRINALSKAMIAIKEGRFDDALKYIESALYGIQNLEEIDSPVFELEKIKSVQHLSNVVKQLREQNVGQRELLEADLAQAIEEEDYEKAARIRDRLDELDEE